MKGVSLPRIKVDTFLDIRIPLPPVTKRQDISVQIEKIEQEIKKLRGAIEDSKIKKKEVLHKSL